MQSELDILLNKEGVSIYRLSKKAGVPTSMLYNLKAGRHSIKRVKVETFINLKDALEGLTNKHLSFRDALRLFEFRPKDLD